MSRSGTGGRLLYALVTAGVAAGAVVAAERLQLGTGAAAVGAGAAWLIQTAAFWPLSARLEAGRPATGVWIGGLAARGGGLAALWGASLATRVPGSALVGSYAFVLLVSLLLEAAWLIRGASGVAERSSIDGGTCSR